MDNANRKKLEQEAKHRAAQGKLVYKIAQRVSAELNLNKLLPEIVTAIQEIFNYYIVALLLLNEKTKQLELRAIAGIHTHMFSKNLSLSLGEGIIGRAASTGEIQLSGNVTNFPYYIRKAGEETKSELAVPVKNKNKTVIGVLDIQSNKPNAFDDTDIISMETLSSQIAIAIENARLYKKAQQEIAERKRIEKELREFEEKFNLIVTNIEDIVYCVDGKTEEFSYVSPAFEKLLGYTLEDVNKMGGRSIFLSRVIMKDNFDKQDKVFKELKSKQVKDVPMWTAWWRCKDGSLKYIEDRSIPIYEGKTLIYTAGVLRDITARKRAEDKLKESERKYRTLFNRIADPIVIFDKKSYRFLDCNKAVQRVYGYSLEELRSMTPYELHPPEDLEKVKYTIDIKNNAQPFTYTHLTKDGRRMFVEILSDEINYQGRPAWISIIRDITERKKAGEKIKAALKEKEKLLTQLHEKNDQIISSIRYAERIQQAILPLSERLKTVFPEHFVIFKPRDIVSGDFYWFNKIGRKVVIAVVDCTGHGVPGAFMSMIGNTLLNEIVNEQRITEPALILENLHKEVRFALKQENGQTDTRDGMDVCLCTLELEKKKIVFAGAKRPLYIVRNLKSTEDGFEFIEIKGDRKSIGGRQKEKKRSFSNHEIEVEHGDMIYLTSDGFVDQNDSEGKKYGSRRLKEFLKAHADLPMDKQREMLLVELERHQGKEDQRDDITVIGIRI